MSPSWSPARALAWESLRLSWRPVVTTTLAWCALAAVYRRLLAPLAERRDAEVFSSLLVIMLLVHSATLLACRDDGLGFGFERRLFRLPLSTSLLVLGRLAPALLFIAAMQAAVTWFMRAVLGAPWPLLVPGLLALAIASWALALSWTCGRRPLLLAPLGLLLLVALLAWLKPLLRADPLWSRLAARDAAILVLATALAVLVAVWGVARSRRAGAADPSRPRPARRPIEGTVAPPSTAPRLPSPRRAQLWMEWRQKGRWLPFGTLVWLAATVGVSAVPAFETGAMLRQMLHDFLPLALFMLPPSAAFLHASFHLRSRAAGIDGFRATRPLGDRELANVLLLSAVRTCAAGWALILAGVSVLALGVWRFGNAERAEELVRGIAAAVAEVGTARVALAACLVVAAAWAAMGMVASIALCGRHWLSFLAYLVPIAAVSALFIADLAGVDLLAHVGPVLLGPFAVLLTLGAAAAWTQAVRGRLIPMRAAIYAALFWAASTLLLARLLPMVFAPFLQAGPSPLWLLLAAPGLAAALVLPLALAPLALRWNRHR